MTFATGMEHAAQVFDVIGAIILLAGFVFAVGLTVRAARHRAGRDLYVIMRQTFGGVMLLALEVFVAADLLRTVAVSPTMSSVLVLGLIVLIRTILSFSLEIEIEGVLPWRRATVSGASVIGQATRNALAEPAQTDTAASKA